MTTPKINTHYVTSNKCFFCNEKDYITYNFKMHYVPRGKYNDKESLDDIIKIDMCLLCKIKLQTYFINKHNIRENDFIFKGWDWWDAIDNIYDFDHKIY